VIQLTGIEIVQFNVIPDEGSENGMVQFNDMPVDDSEVGSLTMYWSFSSKDVWQWSAGRGGRRSEWGQVMMNGKGFWWAWLWIVTL
jgi:hypothetical protein